MNDYQTPSYRPLYQQIKEALLSRIVSNIWPPGTFIPSESALSQEYGVSVGTIRKAVDALAKEHVVIRYQGKGTVVATHDSDRSLFQFFNFMRFDGTRTLPISRVLLRTRRRASAEEANVLELNPKAMVVHIKRVRVLDETPALLEDLVVDALRFPQLESTPHTLPNTLYQLYQQQFKQSVSKAEERLFAVAAGTQEQKHLGVELGSPLIEVRRVARGLQDEAIEYRVSRCDTQQHCYWNIL